MSVFRIPFVESEGFAALVRSLQPFEPPKSNGPVGTYSFTLRGRRYELEADISIGVVVPDVADIASESLFASDGSFITFQEEPGMDSIPHWSGAVARGATILTFPFMVWLFEEDANPRRAARWYGLPDRKRAILFSVSASSPRTFHALMFALTTMREVP